MTLLFFLFEPADFGISPYSVGVWAFVWNLFGVALCVLNPGWLFTLKLDKRADIPFSALLVGGLSSNLIWLCLATVFIKILGKPVSLNYIKPALLVFWLVSVLMPPINLQHKRVEFGRQSFFGIAAALIFLAIVTIVTPYRAVISRGEERVIPTSDSVISSPCPQVRLLKTSGFEPSGGELLLKGQEGVVCVDAKASCIDGVFVGRYGSQIEVIDLSVLNRWMIEIPEEVTVVTTFPGLPKEIWRFPVFSRYFPKTFRLDFSEVVGKLKNRCIRFSTDSADDSLVLVLGVGDEGSRARYLKRSFWLFSEGDMVDWFFNVQDQKRALAPTLSFQYYSQPFWGFYITSAVREVTGGRLFGSELFIVLLFAIFLAVCIGSCAKSGFAFSIFFLGLGVWLVTLLIYFWMNATVQLDVVLSAFSAFALLALLENRPLEFTSSALVATGNRISGPVVPFFIALGYLFYDGHMRKILRRFFVPYIASLLVIFAAFFGYLFFKHYAYGVFKMFWFEIFPEHFFRGANRFHALLNALANFTVMTFGTWLLLLFLPRRSLRLLGPLCALYMLPLLLVDIPHFRYYLPFAMIFAYMFGRFGSDRKFSAWAALLWGVIMLVVSFILLSGYDVPFYLFGANRG